MYYTLYIFYLKEIVYYLCYTSHACRRWSLMPVWLVVDLSGYPVPSMFVSVRKSVKHYRSLILHVKHDKIVTCICYTLSRTHCHIVKKNNPKTTTKSAQLICNHWNFSWFIYGTSHSQTSTIDRKPTPNS